MEGVPEILYETCYHATGICAADSSPGTSEGGGWGISSFLSSRGLKKLQEKWGNRAFPKSLKEMSLFISPKSEYVAVAARHQIRVFHKDDKYMEPCGFYSGFDKLSIFSHGAWSDSCAFLGLVDDKNTIYIVKPSGLEITKIQTKKSASVVGIFMFDNGDVKNSYKCALNILTSDGLVYRVEINQELLETVPCSSISKNEVILKKQYPRGASCLDFHQNLSFLILVGPTGITGFRRGNAECSLSLWHVSKDSELQLLFSIQCEGVLQIMGNHEGPLTTPKVVISPEGTYVAVLDLIGNLETFSLDSQKHSLSATAFSEELYKEMGFSTSPGGKKHISDIADIAWWSDSALVIANRNSGVTMVDVRHGVRLLKTDLAFSSPVLGRPTCYNGLVFLLECNLDMKDFAQMTYDLHNKQETHGMMWKLLSFSERSVLEMYKILINGQQYGAAFQFAEQHAMDKDEIFKSQWLRSNRGMDEINSYLYNVKDANFVLSECLTASAPTEEATRALISYGLHMTDKYRFVETENSKDSETWNYRMMRLQLLQSRDRLDTFLGINMGRFSMHDYGKFRVLPLNRVAVGLAEHGKIGALNLLFKRHLYSMSPFVLEILAAIPETIPVQTYSQLLPDRSPPSNIALRDKDWVEVDQMVCFIQSKSDLQNHESGMHVKTEYILKQLSGIIWPSVSEISRWYMERAMEMDSLSGQLENCLSLVDTGRRKGLVELQQFYEDALCFYDFVYSGGHSYEENTSMSLVSWKQLSDYEKFKMMMKGAKEDTVMETLRTKSIPFMQRQSRIKKNASSNQADATQTSVDTKQESLLVTWLKEIALKNNLEIFLVVIDEACKDFQSNDFFKDETEATEVILECLYLCTLTDRWNVMASILSKVPLMSLRYKTFPVDRDFGLGQGVQGFGSPRKNDKSLDMRSIPIHLKEGIASESIGNLEERVKQTEGHIESGRLLAYYQVPKPLCFFHGAHSDDKGVKQLLRLILSKFGRRQPMRSDNEWANMWRDMLCLQEKAFPFLESEYMLLEFCRGLLKAGKFSLARNYLKGIGAVSLAYEKAEYLVIQAAREYFFSASTLDCSEIWKAKECLNLFPNSKTVRAEIDLIDALTVKLPNLGVTVLPVQYRQIRSPMEIINMVLRSQSAAYLNVDEILEVAKLLGLNSADDIATVEESVAREAAVTGDLELAFDLCLVLARKGHGSIWDLCAAIGRGPTLDKMDVTSRKELISFALSHCDEESVLELLQAWKDLNLQSQCENLVQQTGTRPPNASISGSSQVSLSIYSMQDILDAKGYSINMAVNSSLSEKECLEQLHGDLKRLLSNIGKEVHENGNTSWDNLLKENGKFFSFAALQLPWLFDFISSSTTYAKKEHPLPNSSAEPYKSVSFQAAKVIISWLVNNNIAPRDDLVASLAKSVIKASSDEEKDRNGCLYLLNLGDAFRGVEVIEEQMRDRKEYKEISGITDLGMLYGLLHNSQCRSHSERRNLLLQTFQGARVSTSSGVIEEADSVQSAFWREWKSKLEEQKNLADQARALEEIIPGIETARFLSGDKGYVRDTVFAFIDSVRHEKRHILQNALKLADAYGISQVEVLLHYLGSSLVSEIWTEDDIEAEISPYKKDLLAYPSKVVHMISSNVYSEIDGHKKQRLSYLYGILSDCYSQLGEVDSPSLGLPEGNLHVSNFCEFYNALKEQCKRVSFINGLNFKNIAGLDGLNVGQLHNEVCSHIDESTVEALAQMVDALVCNFDEAGFLSRQDVYKHLILCLLNDLENGMEVKDGVGSDDFRVLIFELEKNYERCSRYFEDILEKDALDMFRRYYTLSLPCSRPPISTDDSSWQECLVLLLNLWIKLANDIHKIMFHEKPEKGSVLSKWDCLSRYLTFLLAMVIENKISTKEGWETIFLYVEDGLLDVYETHVLDFCKTMVFAGCGFGAVADLYIEVTTESQMTTNIGGNANDADSELCCFYVNLTESLLSNMGSSPDVNKKLQVLMSSLSKQVDCSGNIKKVRYAVREILYAFSENVQVSNMYRVYALELLQSITGKKEGSHTEISTVLPWEGWIESLSPVISESVEHDGQDKHGMGRKFTNTLVALKSNEMVSAAWPGVEITPNDINSIQSAVSCFSYLATSAVSGTHMHTLQCLLKEWEGLFSFDGQFRTEEQDGKDDDVNGTGHNWNNDEWDDGWETFQDDLVVQEEKCDHAFSVHPLHACWRILLLKLVGLSQFSEMVKCIDQSLVNPKVTLLDEDEARSLSLLLISIDCFVALKFVLLLPYQTLWFECLEIVDAKLKEGGSREASNGDSELLALILSAGIMSAVVSDAQYRNVTSYLCYLAGYFLRAYREDQLNILKHAGGSGEIKERCYIFGRIIFPHFIAELVKANQYILAGVLVSKFMLAHSSLSLINVAEASLRKFLVGQLESNQEEVLRFEENKPSVVNSYTKLRDKLSNSLESALLALSTDMK